MGTEIHTVDFRLIRKVWKTLISQRSQISAKPHANQSEYEDENDENIRNRTKRAKRSLIPNLRMSVYNKVGALATRAVVEFPSSNNLRLRNLVESQLEKPKRKVS